jgi:hypothetical protein
MNKMKNIVKDSKTILLGIVAAMIFYLLMNLGVFIAGKIIQEEIVLFFEIKRDIVDNTAVYMVLFYNKSESPLDISISPLEDNLVWADFEPPREKDDDAKQPDIRPWKDCLPASGVLKTLLLYSNTKIVIDRLNIEKMVAVRYKMIDGEKGIVKLVDVSLQEGSGPSFSQRVPRFFWVFSPFIFLSVVIVIVLLLLKHFKISN